MTCDHAEQLVVLRYSPVNKRWRLVLYLGGAAQLRLDVAVSHSGGEPLDTALIRPAEVTPRLSVVLPGGQPGV